MQIEKYSFGVGDRFGHEGRAQLSAIQEINKLGIRVDLVTRAALKPHIGERILSEVTMI